MTYWAGGLAALVVAAGSLVGWSPTSEPAVTVLGAMTSSPHVATKVAPPPVAHSRPTHLTIPTLGVSTGVGLLGLLANGQVGVPTSVHTVGWFRLGPTPGGVGSSVILGHVDSYRGPGVFFELKTLHPGALIIVTLADHVVVTFSVTKVVQYSKLDFPDRLVFGSHGTRSLNLVTCGGIFNHATGSYEANIVVFSSLSSVKRTSA